MKCPGQDRRYWKGGAVVEVPCPECGSAVEIFKDESAGRCRRCGHRFLNPGADFGCAKWCSLANECLGINPERGSAGDAGQFAPAARLIQWIELEFKSEPSFIIHALRIYQHAKELVRQEGGDPRIVLSAALLFAACVHVSGPAGSPPGQSGLPPEAMAKAGEALRHAGLDEDAARRIRDILEQCRNCRDPDSIECRIVRDAQALAALAVERFTGTPDQWEDMIQTSLRTETAKNKARSLYHN